MTPLSLVHTSPFATAFLKEEFDEFSLCYEYEPRKQYIQTYFMKHSYMPPILQRSIQLDKVDNQFQRIIKPWPKKNKDNILHVESAGILLANKKKVGFSKDVKFC